MSEALVSVKKHIKKHFTANKGMFRKEKIRSRSKRRFL